MESSLGVTSIVAQTMEYVLTWLTAHWVEIGGGLLLGINAWWTKRNKDRISENRSEIVETKKRVEKIGADIGDKAATVAAAAQRAVEDAALNVQGIKDEIRGITLQINGRVDEMLRLARDAGFRDGYLQAKKDAERGESS